MGGLTLGPVASFFGVEVFEIQSSGVRVDLVRLAQVLAHLFYVKLLGVIELVEFAWVPVLERICSHVRVFCPTIKLNRFKIPSSTPCPPDGSTDHPRLQSCQSRNPQT